MTNAAKTKLACQLCAHVVRANTGRIRDAKTYKIATFESLVNVDPSPSMPTPEECELRPNRSWIRSAYRPSLSDQLLKPCNHLGLGQYAAYERHQLTLRSRKRRAKCSSFSKAEKHPFQGSNTGRAFVGSRWSAEVRSNFARIAEIDDLIWSRNTEVHELALLED